LQPIICQKQVPFAWDSSLELDSSAIAGGDPEHVLQITAFPSNCLLNCTLNKQLLCSIGTITVGAHQKESTHFLSQTALLVHICSPIHSRKSGML